MQALPSPVWVRNYQPKSEAVAERGTDKPSFPVGQRISDEAIVNFGQSLSRIQQNRLV